MHGLFDKEYACAAKRNLAASALLRGAALCYSSESPGPQPRIIGAKSNYMRESCAVNMYQHVSTCL